MLITKPVSQKLPKNPIDTFHWGKMMEIANLSKKLLIGILFIFSFILIGCNTKVTDDCIDPSAISDNPCTMEYNPVCGCDQKTYGNACQAKNSGVRSWVAGECK